MITATGPTPRPTRWSKRQPVRGLSGLLLALSLAACATAPPVNPPARAPAPGPVAPAPASVYTPPAPVTSVPAIPLTLHYERVAFDSLPGWRDDDAAAALQAFLGSCVALKNKPDWQAVCERALAPPLREARAARQFFESQFEPWRVAYDDETGRRSETGLITGYYEPVLRGARKPGGGYNTPLYGVPDDLLSIELSDLYPQLKGERVRGRVQGRKVVPYPERAVIDSNPALRGKELVWVDDALDAFLLQVQGSGRVQLPDGQVIRVAYADQNGQPYKAIARYLVQRGELSVEQATVPGLRQWLAAHPQRLQEVLNSNPSVVFFREDKLADARLWPKGALGVPLTAGRSVAIDPRNLPLGAPLFLATNEPGGGPALQRLVMAQDTGGAIRGVVRADLFWGLGAQAGERAGNMREQGRLWLLWPKGQPLPAAGPGVAAAATSTGANQTVALQSLLQQQTQTTGRRFVIDPKVPAQLRVGNGSVTGSWPAVRSVLRGNGLAAYTTGGITSVVPDSDIRNQPLPVVTADDAAIADDEWVTRTVAVRYLDAAQLVPVLRPLLPQAGQLSAVPGGNALLLVDRYANTRRLIATLREIDKPPAR